MKFRAPAVCFILSLLLLSSISKSCFLVGDLDGDCRVELHDLVIMASQWLESTSCSDAGLVVHWRLDETSGSVAADSSGWGHNGTIVRAAWNPTGGMLSGALQLDGVNGYLWSSYQGITGSNPRTCAAWIKTSQSPGDIMSWGNRDVTGGRWVVELDETGVLRVDAGNGYVFGTTVLTDDRWHHIAVTFDGFTTSDVILYVNGKVETISGIVPQPIHTHAWATTKLGLFERQLFGGKNYFNGLIDDARIYNRALSLKEVWNLATTASTLYDCADLNADQTVNLSDLALLSQNWGDQTPVVLISEFLASNQSRSPLEPGELLDGYGDASDWIELYNNSRFLVDIDGWYLTDDADAPTQWQFPAGDGGLILEPSEYLIVFASGKTQAEYPDNYPYIDPAGYLHTNFSLSRDGEYLGLFASDGITPIHEYRDITLGGGVYGYPPQREDITYGYYYGQTRYFSPPTPGADNIAGAFTGFVDKPDADIKGGGYVDPVEATLACGTDGALIRYTTDGTAPCLLNGQDYTGPITIDNSTTLIAKAFKVGLHPSDTLIETYIFLEPALADFSSNLPIIIVDTLGQRIPHRNDHQDEDSPFEPFIDCQVIIIDTDEHSGRSSIIGLDLFEEKGMGQIRRRGQSTYGQGHYALEFRDEHGRDKYVEPLGMPPESDFILSFDVIDYTLLKMEIAFKWFSDMGHYAPRQRYAEVYLNTGGGKIQSHHYVGLMVLREDINRDRNRVDIARLDAAHDREPRISGGYIIKNDKYDENDTHLWDYLAELHYAPYNMQVLTGVGRPVLQYPPPRRVTQAQINWITDYLKEVSAVLWQHTSSAYYPGPDAVYTDYIDEASWIDHFFVEQITLDSDAFWGSYRTHKEREGKIYSGPPWDFDRSFHNSGGSFDRPYDVWRDHGSIFGRWHQKLQEHLEYQIQLADRWYEHRKGPINTDKTLAYIDDMVDMMSEAMSRPQQKSYSDDRDWLYNVGLLKSWITNRLDYMDGQIAVRFAARPPIFNPAGGQVNLGDSLYISKPAGVPGTIYYTVDGTDPRLPGGQINPNAQVYSDTGGITDTLVPMSSAWTYLYDGSDQGTVWRAYDFDDSLWGSGSGLLGFGTFTDSEVETDIGPRVHGRRSAYFRHTFNVSDVSDITSLEITVFYDDGAVIYINDQEVGRINMPDGEIHYDTPAVNVVHQEPESAVFSGISPDVLQEGENILSVSVHQQRDGSSNLAFDLELQATRLVDSPIVFYKNTCVKSRIKDGSHWSALSQAEYIVPMTLMHYWHFNNLTGDAITSVAADYAIVDGALATYPGTGDGYMDSTAGSDINVRLGQEAGQCLRVRNPSDTRQMLLTLPTTDYRAIQLSYAVMRTTNGARNQTIQYRTRNFGDWHTFDTITVPETYQFFQFDFSDIPAADNNPEFAVRILFGGLNAGGTSGNNRFDNITLEGLALPGTNSPPQLIRPIRLTESIVGVPTILDLSQVVIDPEGEPLIFSAESDKPFVVEPMVSGHSLILTPQYQGDAIITLIADDGYNAPLEIRFRLLAYPAAHVLQSGAFQFDYWSPNNPENTFPDGMLFLQSDASDPGVNTPLEYAYFIPHDGPDSYHADDIPHNVGYPYRTTGRSRINGLDEEGISFINTGRDRDLGGALVALNTTGLQAVNVSWLAGTEDQNVRRYAIRLQYRIRLEEAFADVLANGQPVEYIVQTNGHTQHFGPINLPGAVVNQSYVQLMWRYYHVDGASGARAHLRLDDILIEGQ